jgi:hypothetical protein
MNEGSASPNPVEKCSADAVYGVWTNLAAFRSQMQHKCVEMSLQITTGLAVGVFALMVAKPADPSAFNSPTKHCLVIVVNLYTILQLLILANYLYHTFLGAIHWLTANEFSQKHDNAVVANLIKNWLCSRICGPKWPSSTADPCLPYGTEWRTAPLAVGNDEFFALDHGLQGHPRE